MSYCDDFQHIPINTRAIEEDDINVVGDFDTLNFEGPDVSVTDDGNGKVSITIGGSAVGALIPFEFVSSGNTANKWLGYANSAANSSEIPLISMQDADIKGVSFSNRDDDVDIDLELYVNGTLESTIEVRNKRWFYKAGGLPSSPSMLQGDRISVFLRKVISGTGDQTAQDPIVTIYTKFTDEQAAEGGAQTGVT